jgi:hypothetical protein
VLLIDPDDDPIASWPRLGRCSAFLVPQKQCFTAKSAEDSQYRPRYPDQLISHLAAIAEAPASDLVVDVGSGTGIWTAPTESSNPSQCRYDSLMHPRTRHTPAGAAALSLPRLSGALVHDVGIDIEHRPRRLARGQQCLAER